MLDDLLFGSLGPTVDASELLIGVGLTAAADADDFLIYNSTTGALFYDADGSGGASTAVQFAVLTGAVAINNADFTIG